MLYCACAPLLCHLCPLCHHDMEGGGGGRWHGMPCNGSCRRGFCTCVTCVTCAGRATMTRRGGGGEGGGGGIGKCAATRVVTWVSSKEWRGFVSWAVRTGPLFHGRGWARDVAGRQCMPLVCCDRWHDANCKLRPSPVCTLGCKPAATRNRTGSVDLLLAGARGLAARMRVPLRTAVVGRTRRHERCAVPQRTADSKPGLNERKPFE